MGEKKGSFYIFFFFFSLLRYHYTPSIYLHTYLDRYTPGSFDLLSPLNCDSAMEPIILILQ